MEQPSARVPAEGPSLHVAYEADSRTRCRRGATVYGLLAIAVILATEVLDQGRFPELAGSLLRIRLLAVGALAVVLVLLQSPAGRRHPRPFGLLGPSVVGLLQSSLALATGGPTSPVNISTTFAILGVAFVISWPAIWSALACVVIVGGHVGGLLAVGRVGVRPLEDDLLLFAAASALAVVTTAARERLRWREFAQRWALADTVRQAGASAERYRSVVETAGSVIVVLTPDGRISEFNHEAERVLGWPRAEAIGKDFLALFVPETRRAGVAGDVAHALVQMATRGFEVRMIARSGAERTLVCNASRLVDSGGRAAGVVLCAQDISDRVQVEAALRESEARLRTVVANAPIVLFTLDQKGIMTLSEGKGLARLGLMPGELVGVHIADVLVRLQSPTRYTNYFERAMAGEAVNYVGANNDAVFECWLTPMHDPRGTVTGVIGLAMDVTERAEADDARRALERQLLEAQKLESLGVLAGGVAHDFNNLLASVVGSASLALADLPVDSPAREHIRRIETAARRGSELTRQMLAFAGQEGVTLTSVDTTAVIEEMRELLGVTIPRTITVRYELAPDLPPIEADPTQLRQVVMNLVINAAEAIGAAEGVVTVRTGTVELTAAALAAAHHGPDAAPGPHFCLEVSDTGCGMDAATAVRIFEPFFSTKFAGRGLGLATVLGIVRAHRGALEVTTEPGRGTTFRILLPSRPDAGRVEAPAAPPAHPTEPDAADEADGRTVLLVDDEDDVRAVTTHMLERLGCRVLLAGDGREAIDVFRAHATVIDAVLIDLTLPRLSGEQAAREIHGIRPDTRVILMSGYSDEGTTRHLAETGSAAFLRKPFSVSDLRSTMGKALGRPEIHLGSDPDEPGA